MKQLQELYLDCCMIKHITKDLSEALGQLESLQALSLCCNDFGPSDAQPLAVSLQMLNLTSLDLSSNPFGLHGAEQILGCFKSMPKLTRVSWLRQDVSSRFDTEVSQGVIDAHDPGNVIWWDHFPEHLGMDAHEDSGLASRSTSSISEDD